MQRARAGGFIVSGLLALASIGCSSDPSSDFTGSEGATSASSGSGGAGSAASATGAGGAAGSASSAGAGGGQASCPPTNGMIAGDSIPIVKGCAIPSVPTVSAVNVVNDVTYTSPGGTPVKLDVAWPKGAGLHPLVVLIHGGSWYGGTKALHTDDMLLLAGQGYTAATIDYRTSKLGFSFPAQEADTRCAVRWLKANAAAYAIDPARVAVIGDSAGGHLAAQLGAQSDDPALDDGTCATPGSPRPDLVIAYYGVFDLTSSAGLGSVASKAALFLGATPEADPVKAAEASPILHLDTCDPPLLLTVGSADSIVPAQQTYAYQPAVRGADVAATSVVIGGADHAYPLFGSGVYAPATCTTLGFLAARLGP